jgi:NADH-quinone oxidoreductase subunit B
MWPATFGLACCAIEMMATGPPSTTWPGGDGGVPGLSPAGRPDDRRGRVSQKMGPVLRQIYDQMPEPKWVISMGVCASTGGMFNNYGLIQGVDTIVPVDIYVPGCPPAAEMLMYGILRLHEKVQKEARFLR